MPWRSRSSLLTTSAPAVRRTPRTRPPRVEPDGERRLRRPRRRSSRRRRGSRGARVGQARREAHAARHPARGDVRPPVPSELRELVGPRGWCAPPGRVDSGQLCGALVRSTICSMLRRLRIENLVLIREAELELGPGLNVLSGETGAGKTIFAQAIGLLLGVKGDAAAVGPAANGGVRRGRARRARRILRRQRASSRSPTCGRRTSPASSSPAASSPTAARGRTHGDGRLPGRTWRAPRNG